MDSTTHVYAGFWSRFIATVIDTLIIAGFAVPLVVMFYGWNYFLYEGLIAGKADFFINYVMPFLYAILFWKYMQATPGKIAISAVIVDARTGAPASTGQLIGRYFAYIVSAIPLMLGFIWAAFDSRKQGWHDKLAGTVVVKKRESTEPVKFEPQ